MLCAGEFPLSNDLQIFLELAPCTVIGITGSAGKTTTTSLVGRMAQEYSRQPSSHYRKVFIGGNIGNPLIEYIGQVGTRDLAVMELSSFQLELMSIAPKIAAVLNITPNHLDRHAGFEAYQSAKERILSFQEEGSVAVLNRDDRVAWSLRTLVQGKLVSYGFEEPAEEQDCTFIENGDVVYRRSGVVQKLLPLSINKLRGKHNVSNILAACCLSVSAGISAQSMVSGLKGFSGVDHRLQFVRERHGSQWYNDSIATAPERSIAAILSFDEPLVLLAGGRDKDLKWEEFSTLVVSRVDHLILFGEVAEKIERCVADVERKLGDRLQSVSRTKGVHQAVIEADRLAKPGDVVLLSPGGTSFDEFKDFEERGEWFKKWVNEL